MHKNLLVGIIAAIAVAASLGGYFVVSPLFVTTEVNEPIPAEVASAEFQKFMLMNEEERMEAATQMSEEEEERVMMGAAQVTSEVDENVAGMSEQEEGVAAIDVLRSGSFVGVGGHAAEGVAKILSVNGQQYLRFEQFMVTNGPDLHVYLTTGGDVQNGIDLGKLKGSKGDQNYVLNNIDSMNYDTVVIYCQPFHVVFGTAGLK